MRTLLALGPTLRWSIIGLLMLLGLLSLTSNAMRTFGYWMIAAMIFGFAESG